MIVMLSPGTMRWSHVLGEGFCTLCRVFRAVLKGFPWTSHTCVSVTSQPPAVWTSKAFLFSGPAFFHDLLRKTLSCVIFFILDIFHEFYWLTHSSGLSASWITFFLQLSHNLLVQKYFIVTPLRSLLSIPSHWHSIVRSQGQETIKHLFLNQECLFTFVLCLFTTARLSMPFSNTTAVLWTLQ